MFLGGCCSALTGQSKHKSVYNGESIFDTSSLQQRPITSGCSLCVPAVRSHAAQEADPCCGWTCSCSEEFWVRNTHLMSVSKMPSWEKSHSLIKSQWCYWMQMLLRTKCGSNQNVPWSKIYRKQKVDNPRKNGVWYVENWILCVSKMTSLWPIWLSVLNGYCKFDA